MVVVTDFDIFIASGGASTGTEASADAVDGRGTVAEPELDALKRAARPDSFADASASERSAPGLPGILHAVIPTNSAKSTWGIERRTSAE